MIPGGDGEVLTPRCIPRESGDDPFAKATNNSLLMYSPRERG